MTKNSVITVYHYDENTDAFYVLYKTVAWVHKISSVLTGERGRNRASSVKIRIPKTSGRSMPPAFVGDYVYIGETNAQTPDKAKCFKIYEVAENLFGTNPHYKILAY